MNLRNKSAFNKTKVTLHYITFLWHFISIKYHLSPSFHQIHFTASVLLRHCAQLLKCFREVK